MENASKTSFTYFAFISYSHEDEKWAKQLQNQIETYQIPSVIRKEVTRLPKKVRPVFRDKTNLGAGGLMESIYAELENSHYLIVICSPNSAKSTYVSEEINHFLRLGREKQIIPYIIAGQPHSKDANSECFNPSFAQFQDEPLGINVHEIGKKQAMVKVVAKLLDLRFDVLWQRFRRRDRIRKLLVVLGILLVSLLGVGYWWYTHPTYQYFADYVDTWGVPTGVASLDKETRKHLGMQYRFEYQRIPWGEPDALKWRLSKVSFINAHGLTISHSNGFYQDRFTTQELVYSKLNGQLKQINNYDRVGNLLIRYRFSAKDGIPASIVDFQGANDNDPSGYLTARTTSMFVNIAGNDDSNRSKINRWVITRDENGHIIRKTYHGNNDNDIESSKASDADGIYGLAYELDSLGRAVSVQYLDKDNNPCVNKMGVSMMRYQYNEQGAIYKESSWNLLNDLAISEYKAAVCMTQFDPYGNPIEHRFFGTDGEPCNWWNGSSIEKRVLNKYGEAVEISYYGVDGLPIAIRDLGIHRIVIKYDRKGQDIHYTYYDIDGSLCRMMDGCVSSTLQYDSRGNMIEYAYYGFEGEPCLGNDGFAKEKHQFDANNNLIETSYYGIDGQLCMTKFGYAQLIYTYDDRGYGTEIAYYGADGRLCMSREGYARNVITYDDLGNPVEYAYLNTEGQLCRNSYGIAKYIVKYNSSGSLSSQEGYDENGNLISSITY